MSTLNTYNALRAEEPYYSALLDSVPRRFSARLSSPTQVRRFQVRRVQVRRIQVFESFPGSAGFGNKGLPSVYVALLM